MSLKKRMFRSNMKILFTALCLLMAVILLVLVLFEDTLERQMYAISQTRLEKHVGEVARMVEQSDTGSVKEVQEKVEKWGYQAAALADGEVVSGEKGPQMQDLAEVFDGGDQSGATQIFSFQKATIVGKYVKEQNVYLAAVHFPEKDWLLSSLNRSFYLFLGTAFLAGAAAIACLMLLASYVTRRMNQVVMEPIELLVEGANRMKEGNFQEEIVYRGETEFEHVCQAFNDMQRTILKDQDQRDRTERARTDMVTGISHDLRTPLTSIQGYIKGVLDEVADTEEKKRFYLKTAYESTEEMNRLLQKLFDFSRLESGQMPFHMVSVDLAEYAAAYIAQKNSAAEKDGFIIRMHRQKEMMPKISMDVEQVRRIFDNLFENSLKYAMSVPVVVDIAVKETKTHVLLEWKDNGRGVPPDQLERIFDRFYRCDESRTEKGSGVGLYVVKYIMERHQGSVRAENEAGLKISLYFPKQGEQH